MSSVLIADASELIVEGLTTIARRKRSLEIFSPVINLKKLSNSLSRHRPDLLILDPQEIYSIDQVHAFRRRKLCRHILITSWKMELPQLQHIVDLQLEGFVLKTAPAAVIEQAIANCLEGQKYYQQEALTLLLNSQQSKDGLTLREKEILKLVAQGYSSKAIAEKLYLSVHTIHSYRKTIIKKLDIRSPVDFLKHAIDRKLITPE